jgi:tryptophanyl-tRNA synthetase
MSTSITLTGITTTGTPHLGNYVGAIKPAIEMSKADGQYFFFLADYHALIKTQDADRVHQSTREIAATWLALGLDTDKAVFYRQSDVPQIPELTWFLTCTAAKGLMNRAHAYKDAVQKNQDVGEDADSGINMGLFSYPILMAADILAFNATHVPVGRDQIQHIEMARDIGQRFNHLYGKHFNIPEAVIGEEGSVLKGLDGRKMSKSYDNTIPLFLTEKKLQKHINKIKTNLLEPGEPKDIEDSAVFEIWCAFADAEQKAWMAKEFANGIAWGQAKKELFALVNAELEEPRARYLELLETPELIEQKLREGGQKARALAAPLLEKLRDAVGIRALG